MAFYADEELQLWKCPKHPSKRRRTYVGVCPTCLHDRLSALCPFCAHPLPCPSCLPTSATSSSPSSSSSASGIQVSSLTAFRRSSSVAAIFSRFSDDVAPAKENGRRRGSILSLFKSRREKSGDGLDSDAAMRRSRSVAVCATSSSPAKGKGWYFPSPIKAFRKSSSKVIHERSPLCIG